MNETILQVPESFAMRIGGFFRRREILVKTSIEDEIIPGCNEAHFDYRLRNGSHCVVNYANGVARILFSNDFPEGLKLELTRRARENGYDTLQAVPLPSRENLEDII